MTMTMILATLNKIDDHILADLTLQKGLKVNTLNRTALLPIQINGSTKLFVFAKDCKHDCSVKC